MDRAEAAQVPLITVSEPVSAGWDPHSVWRDRVHDARQTASGLLGDAPTITLADTSAGWDPLETWRIRVQRARHPSR
jgi:hypothetical protein